MKLDYELLDFGQGQKLERFGSNVIMRPDVAAKGIPHHNVKDWVYQASCKNLGPRGYEWARKDDFVEPWIITLDSIRLELRLSQSKNVGVFPEQVQNWQWLQETIKRATRPLNILNLFAYTGGASLVCAQAGAQVCHVDSAKSTVKWASRNAELSGLSNSRIRWIVDDAKSFMAKEFRRGKLYDGIILDPPPIGHSSQGRFQFQKDALELFDMSKKLMGANPSLFLLNAYAMNISPTELRKMVEPVVGIPLEVGELTIKEALQNRGLSCSVFARFKAKN